MDTKSSMNLAQFLVICQQSSNDAFNHFKTVLEQLENPETSTEARVFLSELIQLYQSYSGTEFGATYHFSFVTVDISNKSDETNPLLLLQFPSTFTPEEWSYTFFEGLSRCDNSNFHKKNIVELGCGNGWITIAMAKKFNPQNIVGLDINPRAIVASKINLYINAIDSTGALIVDHDGLSLLDKVAFYESDLLGHFKGKTGYFETIIGCIPQVLSPSEDIFDTIISENQNDEFLYSLSNYCGKQGYIEDQFGLGLIAKAVEESIDVLKSTGRIILNLGGRPGENVLERLFKRRGLSVQKIWQRRVLQAEDTDIDSLVEIEKKSPHRFEFFLGLNSNDPISAKTAKHYLQNGGTISHSLTVYEFAIQQHKELEQIFCLLKDPNYKDALSGLDLDYEKESQKEEKIKFLSDLSQTLINTSYFPYAETEGERHFRNRLAKFFNAYFYTHFTKDHFVVTPSSRSTIINTLHIYEPEMVIVDSHFSWINTVQGSTNHMNVIESPNSSNELCLLIEKLKPQLVITTIHEQQVSQINAFKTILDACRAVNARLIIDISKYLELSSNPSKIGVLSYVAEYGLPPYCSILCELANNEVYNDLQLCLLISQNREIINNLSYSAEFTYSRTPILTQLYYSGLIFELLNFIMTNMRNDSFSTPTKEETTPHFIQPKPHVLEAFAHPSIKGNTLPIQADTVRLDYGENELKTSEQVKIALFESFVRQHLSEEETNPCEEIKQLINSRFNIQLNTEKIYTGNGVAPLFAAVVKLCKAQNGTMLFPEGAYGYFYATAKFYNIPIKIIPTDQAHSFKLSADQLAKSLEGVERPYLFLNFPLVNPTGAVYHQHEMDELMPLFITHQVKVIIDCVFSGLEYHGIQSFDLDQYINKGLSYALIGGISKEFSAGGLRFGYATSNDPQFQLAFDKYVVDLPHKTIAYTVKKLYRLILSSNQKLANDLQQQQSTLLTRFEELNTLLVQLGWNVINPKGGLFLVAAPEKYRGKQITVKGKDYLIDSQNINEVLFYSVGLLINNDVWTGIPGYCRFVLSVEETTFREALTLLLRFDEQLNSADPN